MKTRGRTKGPFVKGDERGDRGIALRLAAASGGGISGRGNPSDRAWRRGHLPLTREANGGGGPQPTGKSPSLRYNKPL